MTASRPGWTSSETTNTVAPVQTGGHQTRKPVEFTTIEYGVSHNRADTKRNGRHLVLNRSALPDSGLKAEYLGNASPSTLATSTLHCLPRRVPPSLMLLALVRSR